MDQSWTTRSYRYALRPFPAQVEAIEQAASAARRYWNNLVATQRWAEHEIRHGRRGSVVNAYRDILLDKAITGMAAAQANKLAAGKNIPVEQAVREMRERMARKQAEMVRIDAAQKKSSKKPSALIPSPKTGQITLRGMSRRQLAVAYAVEVWNPRVKPREARSRRKSLLTSSPSFRPQQNSTSPASVAGPSLRGGRIR